MNIFFFVTKWVGNTFGVLLIVASKSEFWDLSLYVGSGSSETVVDGRLSKAMNFESNTNFWDEMGRGKDL